ncbi:MAG: SIMPL domain-containing protein [Treponema sp.]|nr:SIMPL domain-containing protein [Treponema sp.]
MKRCIAIMILAVFSFSLLSCSVLKKIEDTPRTITVSGTGTVSAQPDKASIVVSVVTQDWVAKTAADLNAEIMTRVQEAVIAAGVSASNITTTNYNISRQDTWQNGRQIPGRYQVRNSMKIVVHNTELASPVIDTAIAAGANELTSLTFSVKDDAALVRQARTLAVQDAQDTASLLAGASGCKIGQVVSIQENYDTYGAMNRVSNTAFAKLDAATPVSAGNIEVSASVAITYALQ